VTGGTLERRRRASTMSRTRRSFRLALLAATIAAVVMTPLAAADADPPSDVLVLQDVYLPYDTTLSPDLGKNVKTTVAKANKKGYRIKVAIVWTAGDLGGVPSFFGKPKEYVKFLGLELSSIYKSRLLVVMPNGYAAYYGTKSTAKMNATLKKIRFRPAGGDDLLKFAATAVTKLSAPPPPPKKAKRLSPGGLYA
jgi:acyl-CoA synthetase (AMP-forming)/AMP-acid ligase II